MNYIQRSIETRLLQAMKAYKAVLVTAPGRPANPRCSSNSFRAQICIAGRSIPGRASQPKRFHVHDAQPAAHYH